MTQLFIDNAGRFIALVVLTCASGIISASETALFSLTRQQINRFRHAKSRSAAIIIVLRDNPTDLLSTVLLCNIFVNILLYSMLGVTAGRFAGQKVVYIRNEDGLTLELIGG